MNTFRMLWIIINYQASLKYSEMSIHVHVQLMPVKQELQKYIKLIWFHEHLF